MALRQSDLTSIEDGRIRAGLTREKLKDLLHAQGIDCVQKTVDRWCLTGRMRTDIYNALADIINAHLPEDETKLPTVSLFVAYDRSVSTVSYPPSRPWSVSALVASV